MSRYLDVAIGYSIFKDNNPIIHDIYTLKRFFDRIAIDCTPLRFSLDIRTIPSVPSQPWNASIGLEDNKVGSVIWVHTLSIVFERPQGPSAVYSCVCSNTYNLAYTAYMESLDLLHCCDWSIDSDCVYTKSHKSEPTEECTT